MLDKRDYMVVKEYFTSNVHIATLDFGCKCDLLVIKLMNDVNYNTYISVSPYCVAVIFIL